MVDSPSGGAPAKATRWDLADTEGCGGGIRFSWCSWMFGGTWIYIGGRSTSMGARGAHETGGVPYRGAHPPISWEPRLLLDLHSKSSGSRSFQKSRSRRFHSVWTLFDIPFLRNTEIGKKTAIWVGPPVSRLVPKMI